MFPVVDVAALIVNGLLAGITLMVTGDIDYESKM